MSKGKIGWEFAKRESTRKKRAPQKTSSENTGD
jgi:hypothetical protein